MDNAPIIYPKQMVAKTAAVTLAQLDPAKVTNQTIREITEKQVDLTDVAFVDPSAITPPEPTVAMDNVNADVASRTEVTRNNITPDLSQRVASQQTTAGTAISIPVTEQTFDANDKTVTGTTENIADKKTNTSPVKTVTEQPTETTETQIPVIATKAKTSKWQYQVYITPATNFKQTVDRKPSTDQFNGPMVTTYGVNADKVIRYKPGMGIEFGIGGLYNVSKRFTLTAGLQYNIRQYNIEAYDGSYELSSISVVTGAAINNVPTLAKYRSYGANYNEALLLNKYHQVSLPVGFEYAIINHDKVGMRIAYTLQPTYTFSQSAYLLTSDYKSYADGTSMIRKWNINSSVEATFNMKVGDFQWKFGPQLRYQHLSTYTKTYPIKEYLIDYGFKIGFTKTIN
jgi:hypothetical protein